METFRNILSDELRKHSGLNFFPLWRINSRCLEIESRSDTVGQLIVALEKVANSSSGIDFQVKCTLNSINVHPSDRDEKATIDRVRVYPKGLERWQPSLDMRDYLALREKMQAFAGNAARNFSTTYDDYPMTFTINPKPDVGMVDLVITGHKPRGVPDLDYWRSDVTKVMEQIVRETSEDYYLLDVSGSGSTAVFRFQFNPTMGERDAHDESITARTGTTGGSVVSILSTRRSPQ